jgi:hypothetical protein
LVISARTALFDTEPDGAVERVGAFSVGCALIAFALVPFLLYIRGVRNTILAAVVGVALLLTTASLYIRAFVSDDPLASLVILAAAIWDLGLVAVGCVAQSVIEDRERRSSL